MFNRTKTYYYGDGTDHEIQLTEREAAAVNKIRITVVDEKNGIVTTNLNRREMRDYTSAADKLNSYLEDHDVTAHCLDRGENILREKK